MVESNSSSGSCTSGDPADLDNDYDDKFPVTELDEEFEF
jgi:hypothetical protein